MDVFEVSIPSGEVRPLVQTPLDEDSPDWSPSRDEILYVAGLGRYDLWIRSMDGRRQVKLAGDVNVNTPPRFSPDGGRIVYGVGADLYVVSAFGGVPIRVLENAGDVSSLAWSPDGAWILLSRVGSGANRRIEKVHSGGGAATVTIAEAVSGNVMAWSPDGGSIFLMDGQGVSRMGADGKGLDRPLAVNLANYRLPTMSVDGRYAGGLQLLDDRWHAVLWDVATRRQISDMAFSLDVGLELVRLRIGPDGKRMLIVAGNRHYALWLMEEFAQPAAGWRRLFGHWIAEPVKR